MRKLAVFTVGLLVIGCLTFSVLAQQVSTQGAQDPLYEPLEEYDEGPVCPAVTDADWDTWAQAAGYSDWSEYALAVGRTYELPEAVPFNQ